MKKIWNLVLALLACGVLATAAVACEETSNGGGTSIEQSGTGGSSDKTEKPNEEKPNEDKPVAPPVEEHEHEAGDAEEREATCEEDGYRRVPCTGCDEWLEETATPALGHFYSQEGSEIVWNEDGSATAIVRCMREGCAYEEEFDATVRSEEITHVGCKTDGVIVWHAVYTLKEGDVEFILTAEKTQTIGATGHDYDTENYRVVWDGYAAAMVEFQCANDPSHKHTVDATVTSSVQATVSCEVDGVTVYTAVAEFEGATYRAEQTQISPAVGHTWDSEGVVCAWSDDYSSACFTLQCNKDAGHTKELTASVKTQSVAATCEADGQAVHTASAVFEGVTYTDEKTEKTADALGHNYIDDGNGWAWQEYESATVTVVCSHDATHKKTLETQIVRTANEPTCRLSGTAYYTATATFDGKTYQDARSEYLSMVDCRYEEENIVWQYGADSYSVWYVSAELKCSYYEEDQEGKKYYHGVTVNGSGSVGGKLPTCTEDGELVYTLTVENNGVTYQTQRTATALKYGHSFSSSDSFVKEWVTASDGEHCESAVIEWYCSNCDTTFEYIDEELRVWSEIVPTCTETGYIYYLAELTIDGFTYSFKKEVILSKIPHSVETVEARAPTCTEVGWNSYEKCKDCKYSTYAEAVIAPAGHYPVAFKCATCQEPYTSEGLSYRNFYQNGRYQCEVSYGNCTDTRVVIASQYNGYPVTKIVGAFPAALESISIPSSVTAIEADFSACTDLNTVYIQALSAYAQVDCKDENSAPLAFAKGLCVEETEVVELDLTGVEKVGAYAFYGAKWVTKVLLPETVKSVGTCAFVGCTAMTELVYNAVSIATLAADAAPFANAYQGLAVTVGEGVTSIPADTFLGMTGVQSVTAESLDSWLTIDFKNEYSNPAMQAGALLVDGERVKVADYEGLTAVNNYTFYGNTALEKIILPTTVKTIKATAFVGCSGVKEIVYGATLAGFSTSPFQGMGAQGLQLIVHEDVKEIPAMLMYGNEKLESVVIPEGVEKIGYGAFARCPMLKAVAYNAVNATTKMEYQKDMAFTGSGENSGGIALTVGKAVVAIPRLFHATSMQSSERYNLTSIFFEADSVCETIGEYAFYGTKIANVALPSSLKTIGTYAFARCRELEQIVIPDGVETINSYAFYDCENVRSASIGKGVELITDGAFLNLKKLESLYFNAQNCVYGNGNPAGEYTKIWGNAGYEGDGIALTVGKDVVTLPVNAFTAYNVTGGDYNRQGMNATSLTFEEGSSLQTIGEYAFSGCKGITSVVLPESLKTVKKQAFYGCSLTELTLPDSVQTVEQYAFYTQTLRKVVVGTGLQFYGVLGFGDSYTELHIGSIESWCGMTVEKVNVSGFKEYYPLEVGTAYYNGEPLWDLVIPEGVTEIKSGVFTFSKTIERITLPSTLTSINSDAFGNIGRLVEILNLSSLDASGIVGYDQKDTVEIYTTREACRLGVRADGWHYVRSDGMTLYQVVSYYGDQTKLTIPDTMGYIRPYAFYGTNLEEITFHGAVIRVEKFAFANCVNLTKVTMSDSTQNVGEYVFENCKNLTELTVGKGFFEFGQNAFSGVTGIKNLYYLGDVVGWAEIEFRSWLPKVENFYMDGELVTNLVIKGVDTVANGSYANLQGITSVIIGAEVTTVENFAFDGCSGMVIYCEATSKPEGWESSWNSSSLPVYWYSEGQPEGEGNYWHYAADGKTIVVW